MEFTIEKIPVWAMCYLVNGDYSGITDEDKAIADNGGNAIMSFPYLRLPMTREAVARILPIIRLLVSPLTLSTAR